MILLVEQFVIMGMTIDISSPIGKGGGILWAIMLIRNLSKFENDWAYYSQITSEDKWSEPTLTNKENVSIEGIITIVIAAITILSVVGSLVSVLNGILGV